MTKTTVKSEARRDANYSDNAIYDMVPNEAAAHELLLKSLHPKGVRCPTCYRVATAQSETLPAMYGCGSCGKQFTILTNTLMEGLGISLQEWWWALFVFTSRPMISAPQDLAARMGWDPDLAHDVFLRLLMAAKRPPLKLREPSEMDWTHIAYGDGQGRFETLYVIALRGRETSNLAGVQILRDQTVDSIAWVVYQHLCPGMTLFTDSHRSNLALDALRQLSGSKQFFVNHQELEWVRGSASINSVEGFWTRLKVFLRRYDWFSQRSLSHCLDGVEWWENHRTRSHEDRIVDLARGLKQMPRRIEDWRIKNPAHFAEQVPLGLEGEQAPRPFQARRQPRRSVGPSPRWTGDGGDGFSDLQFQREIPDEPAADAWFRAAWEQYGEMPRCPRCGLDSGVSLSSKTVRMPYRCRGCKDYFSLKIETVMKGSHLSLRQWVQALLIWSGGDGPVSADELERRMGVSGGTADDVNRRILKAATDDVDHSRLEPPPKLAEDCALWWFRMDRSGNGGSREGKPIHLVILEGCASSRVVVGRVDQSPGQSPEPARRFAYRHMHPSGVHRVFWKISGSGKAREYSIDDLAEEYRWRFQEIGNKVATVFRDVYRGVSEEYLDEYLGGIQWWLNHGHLGPRERMRALAVGMRHKDPPPARTTRKRKAHAERGQNALRPPEPDAATS